MPSWPNTITTHHHQHGSELSETQLRVRALETVLTEKGYVDPAALDAIIEAYETKIGPHNGARVVAKAWSDPGLQAGAARGRLQGGRALGHESRVGDHLVAVENTPALHNMIVCTLCSCYPWEVLGPAAGLVQVRALSLARGEGSARRAGRFRRHLPKDTDIRVWDSTAETRFLVLPMRPAGTDGWSEERLARAGDARFHDRHRPCQAPRGGGADGRHPRHGRHGRLRQGRARAERAAVPRRMGRPRARDATAPWATPALGNIDMSRFAQERCRRRSISPRPTTSAGPWRWRATLVERGSPTPRSSPPATRCAGQAAQAQAHDRRRSGRHDARLVLPAGAARPRASSPATACAPRTSTRRRIRGCRAMPAARSAWSSVVHGCHVFPDTVAIEPRRESAMALHRGVRRPRAVGRGCRPDAQGVDRRVRALSRSGMMDSSRRSLGRNDAADIDAAATRRAAVPEHSARCRRAGLPRALGSAGLRHDARPARARPVQPGPNGRRRSARRSSARRPPAIPIPARPIIGTGSTRSSASSPPKVWRTWRCSHAIATPGITPPTARRTARRSSSGRTTSRTRGAFLP